MMRRHFGAAGRVRTGVHAIPPQSLLNPLLFVTQFSVFRACQSDGALLPGLCSFG